MPKRHAGMAYVRLGTRKNTTHAGTPQNSELNIFVDGYNLLNIRRIGESRNILNIFALNVSNDSVKNREFIIIHPRVCTPSIEIQESGE